MDLLPLPGDASLAGIGDGQAGPVAPVPRGPGPGGAPQGEEAEAARRKGLEAANRRQRGKAEEALLEALRRLQARGEVSSPPPFPGPSRGLTGGCRGPYGRGSDPGPRFGVPGYPGRIPFHPREASLPPPLLAGFMRRGLEIPRNSMRASPRSGPLLCAKVNFREGGKHLSETTRTKRGASPKGTCRRASRASPSTRPWGRALRSGCGRG